MIDLMYYVDSSLLLSVQYCLHVDTENCTILIVWDPFMVF